MKNKIIFQIRIVLVDNLIYSPEIHYKLLDKFILETE